MNRTDEELARVASLNARMACERRDWRTAETLASQAIDADPELVDAYMARGLARRVRGDLAGAEDDYSAAIQRDPALAAAFKWRAGVRSSRAAYLHGEAAERHLLAAERDFRQAVLLDPGDEQARLGLLEAALCAGRYKEAFASAAECWREFRTPGCQVIAAWLGCLAALLRQPPPPPSRHRQWFGLLQKRQSVLPSLEWSVIEVSQLIARVAGEDSDYDPKTLAEIRLVHDLFLSHFEGGRPVLM
ncbi:tetratricopeptide repeat protein [Accumulibacter sp.]|uniref:tetratricopeptide repeat protein n=1 Tax=Accumulibacter sp. TaxID=2053492 RepID=UPI0025E28C53|nr:tetratricopeptide repeat protein [Accumulibacter sp.]MCM8595661.1 tetratricopeptide repeat protein [Accumulibacter sp.]MCM8625995.1 tetratricopeptide repeat protein [Accumulibacter sp.]MDS4049808.1 tetratricopeptide repeat protein [Accumulibacter sp.]